MYTDRDAKKGDTEVCSQYDWRVSKATEIFQRHSNFIYGVIRSYVGIGAEADDLYQEFFLSMVYKPVPPYVTNVKSYLYRAIVNDIIDGQRRDKVYKKCILKHSSLPKYEVAQRDQDNTVENKDEAQYVLNLITTRLPQHQGRAILEKYYHGANPNDVARKMNISKRSLSRYICIGMKRLRKMIREH